MPTDFNNDVNMQQGMDAGMEQPMDQEMPMDQQMPQQPMVSPKLNVQSPIQQDKELFGKKIRAVAPPQKNIGIDLNQTILNNIIGEGVSSQLDIAKLESFSQASQSRETVYELLDTMAEDPTVSAVLETYAEDATETNESGQIVWVQSDDDKIAKYIQFLLDSMEVDKHSYSWVHSLILYGDLYFRLYHTSEFEDALLQDIEQDQQEKDLKEEEDKSLNEDVNFYSYSKNDNYVHYIEKVANPGEMFELTKFGKSYAYIQAPTTVLDKQKDNYINSTYRYSFNKRDVNIYEPTTFVHAYLQDDTSRSPEEVDIFIPGDNVDRQDQTQMSKLTYTVRKGQSILYSVFKIWRELMLLENSMLLNRLTKSSILRVINVEVGDMPKENVGPHLAGIKQLVEQKSALNTDNSLQEYTNPGPMENNIYVPTHNGLGTISTQQVGGDVDVKGLGDIDYFRDKFFGALKVPKQMFGFTEDGAGFNGGQSLTILSSRYAKTIKRIQNTYIQALTDVINLMLIDKGQKSYINKFELHMVPPTTQEEIDRRDNSASKVQITSDIMNLLQEIQDPIARLKILKALISDVITDSEIISILQEQIDTLEEMAEQGEGEPLAGDDLGMGDADLMPGGFGSGMHSAGPDLNDFMPEGELPAEEEPGMEELPAEQQGGETIEELPTPEQLNAGDFTDNNMQI